MRQKLRRRGEESPRPRHAETDPSFDVDGWDATVQAAKMTGWRYKLVGQAK